ncbi:hypothetical protein A3194_20210 [Candidatus Thiodiazotropha endoloripes]|uniref:putative bifunctional diguanylate cyclase/phosphodiesterase n=1 Tax=Candidatus Thiodiazotropha endoloripes TaxID=1818881 RepID=UPI00083E5099|nr:EAL domain-containing protein [Candidatus Thiodiazotropha endoloripes]ODB94989.1 hypothetical protein A3194_20210 [Candidatus Thiodiazotropha endoloripes]
MLTPRNYKQIEFAILIVTVLLFAAFILLWEEHTQNKALADLTKVAEFIQDDLWNYDDSGPRSYLELSAKSNDYSTIKIFDHRGDLFIKVDGPKPHAIDHFLNGLGLISHIELSNNIYREGNSIGVVNAVYLHSPIYLYLNLLLVLTLFLTAVRFFLRSLRELSGRKQAQNELKEERDFADSLINTAQTIILVLDTKGAIIRINPYLEELCGHHLTDIKGKNWFDLFIPLRDREKTKKVFTRTVNNVKTSGVINNIITRNGDERLIEWHNKSIRDRAGFTLGVLAIGQDITERVHAEKIIEHQATFDALTDLPNRRLLVDRLDSVLAYNNRHGLYGALLFIDLDNFKHINDSLGHPIGDGLLKEVAIRLKNSLRDEDFSARLGGDEFVVMYSDLSNKSEDAADHARIGAEKLQKILSEAYEIENHTLRLTPSIGITLIPEGSDDANDLLKHADTAMYRAKESGRNTIRFYLPSMQINAEKHLKLQNELLLALDSHDFFLNYQPQMDASQHLIGAEVLLRWQHPTRGVILPNEFIPLAEKTGKIDQLGSWVLEQSLCKLKQWSNNSLPPEFNTLAINISPKQFQSNSFLEDVEHMLADSGVDPKLLTFELTENIMMDMSKNTRKKMDYLKALGIRISIDDFGTGYSSLAYLQRLPLDELKIDRTFVSHLTSKRQDSTLVETIINMSQHLGLEVIAEGVENRTQFEYLMLLGCQKYQGQFFSIPLSESEFTSLLH